MCRSRAGEIVMPLEGAGEHIDEADFAEKVRRVLNDPSYLDAARRGADSMRKYRGARQAADRIEQFATRRAKTEHAGGPIKPSSYSVPRLF